LAVKPDTSTEAQKTCQSRRKSNGWAIPSWRKYRAEQDWFPIVSKMPYPLNTRRFPREYGGIDPQKNRAQSTQAKRERQKNG
jgi:hypothetical protein